MKIRGELFNILTSALTLENFIYAVCAVLLQVQVDPMVHKLGVAEAFDSIDYSV